MSAFTQPWDTAPLERSRTRIPGLNEGSLKHKQAVSEKHLAVQAILIKDIFEDSDGTYGYRRIQVILERLGVRADGATIRFIMRDLGLQAAGPRAKVRTTMPAEDLDERPDLLRRDFTANEPGKKLCGDITYVRTWAGFIYLATVLDC